MLYGFNVEWLVAYMNQTSSSLEKKEKNPIFIINKEKKW